MGKSLNVVMHCFPHGFRLLNLTIFLVLTGAFCESSESNDVDGSGSGDYDYNDYNSGDGALNLSPRVLGLQDSIEYEDMTVKKQRVKLKSRSRTFQVPPPQVPGPVQAKGIKLRSRSSPVGPTKVLLSKPTAESKFPDIKVTLSLEPLI